MDVSDKQFVIYCFILKQFLPNFGNFLEIKKELIAEMKAQKPITLNETPLHRGNNTVSPPKIKDVIGESLKHISNYKDLDNTKQVVALINDVSMILFLFVFG